MEEGAYEVIKLHQHKLAHNLSAVSFRFKGEHRADDPEDLADGQPLRENQSPDNVATRANENMVRDVTASAEEGEAPSAAEPSAKTAVEERRPAPLKTDPFTARKGANELRTQAGPSRERKMANLSPSVPEDPPRVPDGPGEQADPQEEVWRPQKSGRPSAPQRTCPQGQVNHTTTPCPCRAR
jgi:hypothetical protein